ncbi:MAG TPA: nucleoside-diphosphate kinase [Verrucomicrobiota bacterium]|nr:nucleoside-diphosphate kinase [Verrucomicrobiales bacterium]HRI12087.1 nucleoside-diphosphate kinase [Verrucomicrobiota bacterium]
MAVELAYVLITPYSLAKSRTGGILARLLTRSGCELVAVRMYAPSAELIREYSEQIVTASDPQDRVTQEVLRDYVRKQLAPDSRTGRRRRVLLLLFKGEDAVRRVRSVVGNLAPLFIQGETIRGTFGDYITDGDGRVTYFEPAVLAAPTAEEANAKLLIWARYSRADGGLLDNTITYEPGVAPQRTLVLVKPDNFGAAAGRPGSVLDFFSRTGLFIVGARLLHLSTAQALAFYEPVREVMRTRLNAMVGAEARKALSAHPELGFPIPPTVEQQLGQLLGPLYGDFRFDNLVRFMSGRSERECPPAELEKPGTVPCLAVVYEGPDAVAKCRDVLGPTDPGKAPRGTIRREFGSNILVNAAHASDSVESARRELAIVQPETDDLSREIAAVVGPR